MDHTTEAASGSVWKDRRAIGLLLSATLTVMAVITISPTLAGLQELFASNSNVDLLVRMLVPAPALSVIFFAPLAGLYADRVGRRSLLLMGVAVFVIAGTGGLYLPALELIFASRLLLGVGMGMIMTAVTALIGDYFQGTQRAQMLGLQISARNFGGLLFISLAGWLAVMSPRLPFAIYGLAGLLLPFLIWAIREPKRVKNASSAQSENETETLYWQVWLAGLAVLQVFTNMVFFVMPTQLPFFFEAQGTNSAAMTGFALALLTLAGGFAALAYSKVRTAFGVRGAYVLGYGLMALGFVLVPHVSFLGTFAVGAGYATVTPNFSVLVLQVAPSRRRGFAGGVLTTSVFTGQFLSPFLSIALIDRLGYADAFSSYAVVLAMFVCAGLMLWAWEGLIRSRRYSST